MSSLPSLAIIIPTCDRPRELWDCVYSVLPQLRMATNRIYVVNDGDPGSVESRVLSLPGIRLLEHCKPYYARASALNAALVEAAEDGYDYGLILDDDCTLRPDAIHYHREAWKTPAEINSKRLYVGMIHQQPYDTDLRLTPACGGLKAALIRYGGTVNLSFPLAAIQETGGFDERFDGQWGFEDAEFYSRLILRDGWEFVYVRNAIADHEPSKPATMFYSRKEFGRNKDLYERLLKEHQEVEQGDGAESCDHK